MKRIKENKNVKLFIVLSLSLIVGFAVFSAVKPVGKAVVFPDVPLKDATQESGDLSFKCSDSDTDAAHTNGDNPLRKGTITLSPGSGTPQTKTDSCFTSLNNPLSTASPSGGYLLEFYCSGVSIEVVATEDDSWLVELLSKTAKIYSCKCENGACKGANENLDPVEVGLEGDMDKDGLTNQEEDPDNNGINGDRNNDHIWDPEETWTETDPTNPDTDGDGVKDGDDNMPRASCAILYQGFNQAFPKGCYNQAGGLDDRNGNRIAEKCEDFLRVIQPPRYQTVPPLPYDPDANIVYFCGLKAKDVCYYLCDKNPYSRINQNKAPIISANIKEVDDSTTELDLSKSKDGNVGGMVQAAVVNFDYAGESFPSELSIFECEDSGASPGVPQPLPGTYQTLIANFISDPSNIITLPNPTRDDLVLEHVYDDTQNHVIAVALLDVIGNTYKCLDTSGVALEFFDSKEPFLPPPASSSAPPTSRPPSSGSSESGKDKTTPTGGETADQQPSGLVQGGEAAKPTSKVGTILIVIIIIIAIVITLLILYFTGKLSGLLSLFSFRKSKDEGEFFNDKPEEEGLSEYLEKDKK